MIQQIKSLINNSDNIAVLTGAGVSTASGIPDFRSSEGLWTEDKSREELMSADYFYENPERFWQFYKSIFRLKLLQNYGPNQVHYYLKSLEKEGREVNIITQNVDGLHAEAGNENVTEYHGTLKTATCPDCHTTYSFEKVLAEDVPVCACGAVLKPDVVLFGDMIHSHEKAETMVKRADMLLVLGTSLSVMPFNMLPLAATGPKVLINNHPTSMDYMFDYHIHDDLSRVIEQLKK